MFRLHYPPFIHLARLILELRSCLRSISAPIISSVPNTTSTTHLSDESRTFAKTGPPPAHLQPQSSVDIDPDGDLFLDVPLGTGGTHRFRVCSATLRRLSPVFKAMLSGPLAKPKPANGENWAVQLPDHPIRALTIVLHIMHSNFDEVAKLGVVYEEIHLELLWDIVILTKRYNMTSIVRPWCNKWIAVARRGGFIDRRFFFSPQTRRRRFLFPLP